MLKYAFVVLFLPLVSTAANLTNFSISGAYSNYDKVTSGTGSSATSTHTLYGGISNGTPCLSGVTGTCNTCTDAAYVGVAGTANVACNPQGIGPDSTFSITFTSATTGNAQMITSTSSQVPLSTGGYSVAYTAGQTITLSYKWGDICAQISGGTTACTVIGNVSLNVGVAASGTTLTDSQSITFSVGGIDDTAVSTTSGGFEDFTMFPGDEKAYVKSINTFGDTSAISPGGADLPIKYLAVFYTEGTCTGLGVENPTILNSFNFTPLEMDSEGLITNKITGLRNGTEYLFKIGMQDVANNIGLFTTTNISASGNACAKYYQTVIPQRVFGLLNDGDNCFIATAAFGSIMDSRVQVFRDFRDQFLLKTNLGKKFVNFYYKHSPPLAHYIADRPVLRAVARGFLYPLLGFAWLYVNVGGMPANLIFMFVIFCLVLVVRKFTEKNDYK